MFNLEGKTALVTGARRGMGKAHAEALARQGARVVVTDVHKSACEDVASGIREAGGQAIALTLDVSQKESIDETFDAAEKEYGRIDILINNAAVFERKPAFELSAEDWQWTLGVNLTGAFLCAQRAAKNMSENGWGRIINIASVSSGQVGNGVMNGAHYAASKGGVIAMTESLAIEWAPFGITVNAIAPGSIDTDMSRVRTMAPPEFDAFVRGRVPLGRIGRPEEVSPAVVYLASEEASYVTGTTLYVDGGWLAL